MKNVYSSNRGGNTTIVDKSENRTDQHREVNISVGNVIFIAVAAIVAIAVIVVIVVCLAAIINGSTQIEDEILGTWHNNEISDLYIVFSEDNSLRVDRSDIQMSGTYIFVDDNRIKLSFNAFIINYTIYADVSVQNNTLTFNNIEDSTGYFFTSSSTTFKNVK